MNALNFTKQAFKATGQEIADRVDPRTTRVSWRKVRDVCAIVAAIGALFIPPMQIIVLPATATSIVTVVTAVSGVIAGRTWLDKKGKK